MITAADKKDAAAITELINSAYEGVAGSPGWTSEGTFMQGERITEPEIATLLGRADADCYTCTLNGEIIGFVSLEKQAGFVYLGLLTVSPQVQAGGIGRRLLTFGEDYARAHGLGAVHITVVNIRYELIAWYERRGYRATGKTVPFPKADRPKQAVELMEMKKELE